MWIWNQFYSTSVLPPFLFSGASYSSRRQRPLLHIWPLMTFKLSNTFWLEPAHYLRQPFLIIIARDHCFNIFSPRKIYIHVMTTVDRDINDKFDKLHSDQFFYIYWQLLCLISHFVGSWFLIIFSNLFVGNSYMAPSLHQTFNRFAMISFRQFWSYSATAWKLWKKKYSRVALQRKLRIKSLTSDS